jgi:uncharacterized coiled-coil DUF342 family protein
LALLVVASGSVNPVVDSSTNDNAVKAAIDAETVTQSDLEQAEDQAVKTAVRVKQLRRILKEVRQVASIVSSKDDDLPLEKPLSRVKNLKNITTGAARGLVTSFWKNAVELEHRIRPNEQLDAGALGVPHPDVNEVKEQLSEAQKDADQAKRALKSARAAEIQSERDIVSAEEQKEGKIEAALEAEIVPIQNQLQSAYTVLGRASVESEEAAQDANAAEDNDAKIALAVNEAEAALQVSRQELAPLSGQLQSLAVIELALRQSLIQSGGDQPNMSNILQSVNVDSAKDATQANAVLQTAKASLDKLEHRWQRINAHRTNLHHRLQEKVTRLASDAEEFQGNLNSALSADLALLVGLHDLGDNEIACNGAREDLSRIQGYLKHLQQQEKQMKKELVSEAKKHAFPVKLLHASEAADEDAVRLVGKVTHEPGSNVGDSALEASGLDALKNLEAKARSLEHKIAKLESRSFSQAPMKFKLREDQRAEPQLSTAILHASSAAQKACKVNSQLDHLRAQARTSRTETRAFGGRVAATERVIYGIQQDLTKLGQNRRKLRKELHSLRNRTIVLAEDAGRLAEGSKLTKLLSTKQPWEVEQSIANERINLEGMLTQKQVAVHEQEQVLSDLQAQMRECQTKLGKGLQTVAAGRKSMQKSRKEVRDLEKKLNQVRKRLETQSTDTLVGNASQQTGVRLVVPGKFRGKHHSFIH